jgi:PncC family amidohydrolase
MDREDADRDDTDWEDADRQHSDREERSLAETARQVVEACVQRGWTIALAESCTGGQASAALTAVAGASQAFWGGIVVYSAEAKCALAGLDPDDVTTHGVVSDVVTRKLAGAVRDLAGSDLGLAVTCWAGPESAGPDPVGSVYLAVATRSDCRARALHVAGSRSRVRVRASTALLALAVAEASGREAGGR